MLFILGTEIYLGTLFLFSIDFLGILWRRVPWWKIKTKFNQLLAQAGGWFLFCCNS